MGGVVVEIVGIFAIFSLPSIIIINVRIFLTFPATLPVSVSHIREVCKVYLGDEKVESRDRHFFMSPGLFGSDFHVVTSKIIKLMHWHFFL